MLSTMALMAPQQPAPPSEHERELVLGIEQGIEQGKKAAEHDKVYEEVPFYPQPNQTVWPLRIGLAAREARWMRVELSKILTNLGKFELPSSGSASSEFD